MFGEQRKAYIGGTDKSTMVHHVWWEAEGSDSIKNQAS